MAWNVGIPLSSSKVLITSTLYLDNWDAIDDAINTEHYGMTSSLSGRHRRGIAGGSYVGTSAAISALTAASNAGPGDGALAFSTTSGCGLRFTESGAISAWRNIGVTLPQSRVMAYQGSNMTIASATSGIPFSGATESVDTLGEFNSTTGIFSACTAGYYLVAATVLASASSGYTWGIGLCGSSGWQNCLNQATSTFSAQRTCQITHLTYLSASAKVACYAYCSNNTIGISGTSSGTYFSVYKVC